MTRPVVHALALLVVLATSCAIFKSSPPTTASSKTEPSPAGQANVEGASAEKGMATAEPSTPDAQAEQPADEAKPKTASGRPLAIYEGQTGPMTVAFDGAAFRLEGAEIRIPTGALRDARNIVFTVDKKVKGAPGKVGVVYLIDIQMPERQYVLGQDTQSRTETSRSTPFIIKLPLPAGVSSGNLAVESVTNDEKTNKPRSSWSVYGMTKLESSDGGNRAVFEVPVLPDGHMHVTTSQPTQAAE